MGPRWADEAAAPPKMGTLVGARRGDSLPPRVAAASLKVVRRQTRRSANGPGSGRRTRSGITTFDVALKCRNSAPISMKEGGLAYVLGLFKSNPERCEM